LLQKILVAYDDPESATLERAGDLARALGAELVVTNVAGPVEGEDADEATRYARERLDQARDSLASRGVAAEFVPSVGRPADAIVRLAKERGSDLIVVGTRKKGFIERLVEGSVNQEVIRRAPCDVLVVY
jgi:nucleotide-binding universal stress UspA family protein